MDNKTLYGIIKTLIEFPNPTVCKHHAALEILNAMEIHGTKIDRELVKNIVEANDFASMKILKRLV